MKLISNDNFEFIIKREIAMISSTITGFLTGPFISDASEIDEVQLRTIDSKVLNVVCRYLNYKYKYSSSSNVPEFLIPIEFVGEVLMAADFLDI